jgi:drug/metabolite transporter (DMT)-like permease
MGHGVPPKRLAIASSILRKTRPMQLSPYRLGLFFITGSALAWSTTGLFARLIALDSFTMLAWRGLFGAVGIAVVALATERGEAWRGLRRMGWDGWLYTIVSAVGMLLFITAFQHTTVAHVAVIYATAPFLAAALAWSFLRERPGTSAVAASLAALLGVLVMVGFGVEGGILGDLLAFGMTLCMAALMVMARRFRTIPVMPAAALSALLTALVAWPLGEPLSVDTHQLVLLALFGIVNSALGLALFTLGARLIPAIETALIGALDAPLAPLWVWLAFGETPSRSTLAGGAVVFGAVALHMAAGARRPVAAAAPQ